LLLKKQRIFLLVRTFISFPVAINCYYNKTSIDIEEKSLEIQKKFLGSKVTTVN
jgi:hypothetical protein